MEAFPQTCWSIPVAVTPVMAAVVAVVVALADAPSVFRLLLLLLLLLQRPLLLLRSMFLLFLRLMQLHFLRGVLLGRGRWGAAFDPFLSISFHPSRPSGALPVFSVPTSSLGVAGLVCSFPAGTRLRQVPDGTTRPAVGSDLRR